MSKIKATKEDSSGRNIEFNVGGKIKKLPEVIKEVKRGDHPGYHVVEINGRKYIRANPDKSSKNNVGK